MTCEFCDVGPCDGDEASQFLGMGRDGSFEWETTLVNHEGAVCVCTTVYINGEPIFDACCDPVDHCPMCGRDLTEVDE